MPPRKRERSRRSISIPNTDCRRIQSRCVPEVSGGHVHERVLFHGFCYLLVTGKSRGRSSEQEEVGTNIMTQSISTQLVESRGATRALLGREECSILNRVFRRCCHMRLDVRFVKHRSFGKVHPFCRPVLVPLRSGTFRTTVLALVCRRHISGTCHVCRMHGGVSRLAPRVRRAIRSVHHFQGTTDRCRFGRVRRTRTVISSLLEGCPSTPKFLGFGYQFIVRHLRKPRGTSRTRGFLSCYLEMFPRSKCFVGCGKSLL